MKVLFIGDELSAAGFRLTGIGTLVPGSSADSDGEREALARASFVIAAAGPAAGLAGDVSAATGPLVAAIPDILGSAEPPDLVRKLRRILGIET